MSARPSSHRVLWWGPGWGWDVVFAMAIVGATAATVSELGVQRAPLLWVVELAPAGLMLVRRRWPWIVLGVCMVGYVLVTVAGVLTPVTVLPVAFAVFTIAVEYSRTVSLMVAAGVALTLVAVTVPVVGRFLHETTFQVIEGVGVAVAVGITVRTRRAYVAEIRERAERAEASRDAEAARRVTEDRLRIAQDLHDTVAHQISVISLNAGVATATLDAKPDVARDALATIRAASRNVLSEIGALLSSLRLPGEVAPTAPTVSLDHLPDLIASFTRTGFQVTLGQHGDTQDVTPAVSAVAYRVVQEALTNAHKHGVGNEATVRLEITPAAVHLDVTNLTANTARTDAGTGHGLVGVRERVASVRGTVRVERPPHAFRLIADLPLHDPKAPS